MVNTQRSDNQELLDAVQRRHSASALILIERGVDVNASSSNGWTPIMLAVLNNDLELVGLLIENGADPGLTTTSEENPCRSPLAVAVSNGRLEIVELLMKHGVNRTDAPCGQPTPLDLARKLALRPLHQDEMVRIVRLLEED